MTDPLRFAWLQSRANESFFAASSQLADPVCLRRIRSDLPIYLFSGSEDTVGHLLAGVRVLIERYRNAGLCNISHDFYPGGRHDMLHEIKPGEVEEKLLRWICTVLEKPQAGRQSVV